MPTLQRLEQWMSAFEYVYAESPSRIA